MKKLGIIGGMGPLATARLFELIVEMTKSDSDAGHIRTLIDCNPGIPDRTRAILDGGESPVPEIVKTAEGLIDSGAEVLLLACNTSHYYFEEIEAALQKFAVNPTDKNDGIGENTQSVEEMGGSEKNMDREEESKGTEKNSNGEEVTTGGVKLINLIEETGNVLREKGLTRVGVLATRGAVEGKVFEKYLEPMGISVITPDKKGQDSVNSVIYDAVKAGRDLSEELAGEFCETCRNLIARGAQALILGCTEIPLAMDAAGLWDKLDDIVFVDTIRVLAQAGIREARGKV
jgi:aspartate racemase